LEERGWAVDAHVVVSPKGDVRQGDVGVIDTARYSAVLAMDSTAARYGARIDRFVRQGGGLVLWAPAAAVRAFAGVSPAGALGPALPDVGRTPSDSAPRDELELRPLLRLAADAVVLERRGSAVALASRRAGAGRVLLTGYSNSWRWRMAGGDDAPEEHRTWLAGMVAQVAYTGRRSIDAPPTAAAPLATLIDRLGPQAETPAAPGGGGRGGASGLAFALICAALLAEWASRRLRGAR
ncbi:MAG TPA: hypothetical protein VHQ45_18705, partial [Gemmatimonadaceae bacterium]|nr:hypothetical protein [Gemmatimonadaceae bacterium]